MPSASLQVSTSTPEPGPVTMLSIRGSGDHRRWHLADTFADTNYNMSPEKDGWEEIVDSSLNLNTVAEVAPLENESTIPPINDPASEQNGFLMDYLSQLRDAPLLSNVNTPRAVQLSSSSRMRTSFSSLLDNEAPVTATTPAVDDSVPGQESRKEEYTPMRAAGSSIRE
ncbi:uncharacterized protein DSM5745_03148 [Aspergillus mulundensis]|uniref:Uncharacterized protein n=1 Tax=Aspergillus mulundensis TaxID=1810919 RepID=A0A3D8SJN9_9EURO|nr:hypothetical protein DSM5745_03148 [Aspergillus mulundensis]RDW86506.1 hypothetical protein DSM5745_03148 [Aspergillus mulundensis]